MPRARLKGRLAGQPARCAASASRAVRHAARSHAAQPTLLNSSGPSRSNAPPSTSASDATCCQSTCATIRSPASWRAPAGSSTTSRLARTVFASISAASAVTRRRRPRVGLRARLRDRRRAARRQRDDHVDRIGDRVAVERHEARRLRGARHRMPRCRRLCRAREGALRERSRRALPRDWPPVSRCRSAGCRAARRPAAPGCRAR